MTGWFRENPEKPTSSADPAPSMTRLAAPHADREHHRDRREQVPRHQRPSARLCARHPPTRTIPYSAAQTHTEQRVQRCRESERQAGPGDCGDARTRAGERRDQESRET